MRKFYLLALVMLFSVASTFIGASSASAATPDRMERQIQKLHNRARAANHLPPLRASKCLDRFAEKQARAQARKRTMYHQEILYVVVECKNPIVGENVAAGFKNSKDANKAWLNSPGHRANVLSPSFRKIGVGVARGKNNMLYYSVVFSG